MNKILISGTKKINLFFDLNIDGFVIGLKNFSYGFNDYFKTSEIANIDTSKDVFVSINKLIHNNELDALEEDLKALKGLNIAGIIFEDLAVVSLSKKLDLNIDLVWGSSHLVNNVYTMNYWNDLGVTTSLLSNELTLEEIKEIINNSKGKVMMQVFGYNNISYSYRHLLNNYYNCIGKKKATNKHFLKENKSADLYPIIENEMGTFIYSSKPINAINEVKELKLDYLILNNYMIDDNKFIKIVNNYLSDKVEDLIETDKGFLYQKTCYRVKKNEED